MPQAGTPPIHEKTSMSKNDWSKKNKSQYTAIFYVKYSLLIQYMKMYISEVYVYQRISLQHWKRREKLSFTLGTPIVGHPIFSKIFTE